MSILFTLRKLIDVEQHVLEQGEMQRDRELVHEEGQGGAPPDPSAGEPRFFCRVCGHRSPDRTYCPDCLADTMVPLPKERAIAAAGDGDGDQK